jgi:hypothetical protein
MKTEFKIGDKVDWLGLEKVVEHINYGHIYPVRIVHNGTSYWFTLDGRSDTEHTNPSLKLISRAKKTKTFELHEALIMYQEPDYELRWVSKNFADALTNKVKFTGKTKTVEVEVE